MRGRVAARLDRLVDRGEAADLDLVIRGLATEHGLDPAEVRAEWDAIEARARRFGPSTIEQAVRRCAEELHLPEDELRAGVGMITGTMGSRP